MFDLVKTQVLKEMRKGVPPKIVGIFDYYKADALECFHNQGYQLEFFDDGTVFCWEKHQKFDPYGQDPEAVRESDSVGVFEVRVCETAKRNKNFTFHQHLSCAKVNCI